MAEKIFNEKYKILSESIGSGAYGSVNLATNIHNDKK